MSELETLRSLLVGIFRGEQVATSKLTRAAARVVKGLGADEAPSFESWQKALGLFDSLEEDARAVEVARGLRLCRVIGGSPRAQRAKPVGPETALTMSTETLPGIGPKASLALSERGIDCVGDLVYFVPRRYDDARIAVEVGTLSESDVGQRLTIKGSVESRALVRRGKRRWIDVRFEDGGHKLIVRFFGAFPSALDRYAVGTDVVLAGTLTFRAGAYEMGNPDVLAVGTEKGGENPEILPRYRSVPGVPGKRLAKAAQVAVARGASSLVSSVPEWVEAELELVSLEQAVRTLHCPPGEGGAELAQELNEQTTQWQRRLAFEEMFALAAQISRRRAARKIGEAIVCADEKLVLEAMKALPFEPTRAQHRVGEEIASDIALAHPMNRLLQGDVGCGKTAVAFIAAARVIGAKAQVALMAPTELLAEQHAKSLGALADECGIRTALFTGSQGAAQRRSQQALLSAGKIDLAIGTHSLISSSLEFHRLGLAIVDEQHRFGVAQRVELRRKGQAPHLLVMTATPIPRSLALSVYGDLDVSVIDELPPGRRPTATHVMSGARGREATYVALERRLAVGERAFVVCPLVEPAEEDVGRPWHSAQEVSAELRARYPEHGVGLIHGRMSGEERDAAMERFRSGRDQVLVATTVIEVGVDVPEATVMIVEDANHFGLAQLHQLRGRVGRGELPGECALLCRGTLTSDAEERLKVMAETTDGFRIAEADLEIRGPGELLGSRQAGLPAMRFGDLRKHLDLLATARRYAAEVISADPELNRSEHAGLKLALDRAASQHEAFDAEGG